MREAFLSAALLACLAGPAGADGPAYAYGPASRTAVGPGLFDGYVVREPMPAIADEWTGGVVLGPQAPVRERVCVRDGYGNRVCTILRR